MVLQARRVCLALTGIATLAFIIGLVADADSLWQPALVVAGFGLAIGLGAVPAIASYQYTGWIVACVILALVYPGALHSWGGVELAGGSLMTTIVQLVMFGMATQMSIADFAGVVRHPRGVPVGLLGHYLVMPVAAYLLVQVAGLPSEIGLGVILYGCVSSGLASNVMSLLARANLGLAVTITALSTVVAPIATPALMTLLAGKTVDVSFLSMMFTVIQLTLVPVMSAILVDYIKTGTTRGRQLVHAAAVLSAAWLVTMAAGGWHAITSGMSANPTSGIKSICYLAGGVLLAEAYAAASQRSEMVRRAMPYVSMFGIMYYNTITTAAGRDALLKVGGTLLIVGLIHNLVGYTFGYWAARAFGLPRASARATTFEVGLQNGGTATGLAASLGMLGTAGLAAAVFSPLGNVTGSLLANYWSRRPTQDEPVIAAHDASAPSSEAPAQAGTDIANEKKDAALS